MIKSIYSLLLVSTLFFTFSCQTKEEKTEEKKSLKEIEGDTTLTDDEKKIIAINEKIRKDPNNPNFYNERASYYYKKGMMGEALNDVDRCIKIDSTIPEFYITKGDIYFAQLKAEEAKNQFEKAKAVNKFYYQADLKLSKLYLYIRNYKKAMEFANNALKTDKTIAEAYFIKGSIYEEMRDSANASSSFQTAIEQDPNYYDAYIRLGILYSKLPKKNKKRALAYDYYNSAISIKPDFIEGHYNKAIFCQENEMIDEALNEYDAILEIDPTFQAAWHNKGYVYLVYKEDYKTAIEFFTKTIDLYPKHVPSFHNRGLAWLKLKDIARAKEDFNRALQIDPQYDKSAMELDKLDRGIVD